MILCLKCPNIPRALDNACRRMSWHRALQGGGTPLGVSLRIIMIAGDPYFFLKSNDGRLQKQRLRRDQLHLVYPAVTRVSLYLNSFII